MALILRLALLGTIAFIVQLTQPVFTVIGHGFSWRDLILIGGGLFLVWKATKEIHHNVDPADIRRCVRHHQGSSGNLDRPSGKSCCSTWSSPSTALSPLSA
jgi:predicted tellurium resistance membrane protein TerC